MSSNEVKQKSIHAALISQENDKLKELLLELKFVLKDDEGTPGRRDFLKKQYGFEDSDALSVLSNEDVKVRQFGAFCIAGLMGDSAAQVLVDAYLHEDVEYNKEHFVKALSELQNIAGRDKLYYRL